jgi:hypothetical protein
MIGYGPAMNRVMTARLLKIAETICVEKPTRSRENVPKFRDNHSHGELP